MNLRPGSVSVSSCLLLAALIGCGSVSPEIPDADPPDADPPDVMPMCGNGSVEFGEECDDSGESAGCDADCTAASCGDGTTNETAGEDCDASGQSADCDDDCTLAECGDGVTNAAAAEDCDDSGQTATCDGDCTAVSCGDGTVNDLAGEACDLGAANDDRARCGGDCNWGPGLDGTFDATAPTWETRTASGGNLYGLQSFHYTGMTLIRDSHAGKTYNPASNVWGAMPIVPAGSNSIWSDAAVGVDAMFTPRDGNMWKLTYATGAWTIAHGGVPNGTTQLTAADYDGEGRIWYKGPLSGDLVRYDPATGMTMTIAYVPPAPMDFYETRVVYDPITNSIAYGGYNGNRFAVYDIDTGAFTLGTVTPGGRLKDNTCGDRSGHAYSGSEFGITMHQYTIATDSWVMIPNPPAAHDNVSTCVVSQDGWLYYATGSNWYRLSLGTH
jgi:hypothetical protein